MKTSLSLSELRELQYKLQKWLQADAKYFREEQFYEITEDGKLRFNIQSTFFIGSVLSPKEKIELNYRIREGKKLNFSISVYDSNSRTLKWLWESSKGKAEEKVIITLIEKIERIKTRLNNLKRERIKKINDKKLEIIGNQKRISKNSKYENPDLIRRIIARALKIGEIPKLKDLKGIASTATLSRCLNDKKFLGELVLNLTSLFEKKYNYASDKTALLEDMIEYYSGKGLTVKKRGHNKKFVVKSDFDEGNIQLSQSDRKRNKKPYLEKGDE